MRVHPGEFASHCTVNLLRDGEIGGEEDVEEALLYLRSREQVLVKCYKGREEARDLKCSGNHVPEVC